MEIYLIRHTTPEIAPNTIYGQTDLPLIESFPQELKLIEQHLPSEYPIIYHSPLQRCRILAEALQKGDTTLQSEDNLKELNFGDWEMKRWDEIPNNLMSHWREDFVSRNTPNGESFGNLIERARLFWERLLEDENEVSLVVTHGGFIRALIVQVLEIPPLKAYDLHLDFGCVSKLEKFRGRFKLSYLNRR